jgi:hypothetical protein
MTGTRGMIDAAAFGRDWGPLLTLSTSVALAFITGWYALLTKRLAKSSSESAQSARIAAEASRAGASAAEASVNVRFSAGPVYLIRAGGGHDGAETVLSAVTLTCTGATVHVHGVTMRQVGEATGTNDRSWVTRDLGEDLEAYEDSMGQVPGTLPLKMHHGETMFFRRPDDPSTPSRVATMEVNVAYSLDGEYGGGTPLRVTWRKKSEE